jgi:alanine dehydrogenase
MNDGFIQHMRVAASAALGMKYLSRLDSRVLGIIGSGGMARFFPLTASVVRRIERLLVYSPTRANLERYCQDMAEKLDCEIVPAHSTEEVVRGSDIVCACTTSMEPVMQPEWIQPGTHLNNVTHWELGPAVCSKVNSVGIYVRRRPVHIDGYLDDDFGIRLNVMSYTGGQPDERARVPVGVPNRNRYPNAQVVDCIDWETNEPFAQRRSRDEITILANASYGTLEGDVGNSAGIQGIQFSTIGGKIYERAKEQGLGQSFPLEMFLQDIPT